MEFKSVYDFPEVGKKDMYLLHHEEIESLAKKIFPGVQRIRFLYDIRTELSDTYEMSGKCRMLSTAPVEFNGQEIVPIQFLKALLPDPASLGPRTVGKQISAVFSQVLRTEKEKSIYIYNVCDHQECYKEVESQAISYTTGVPAMIGSMMVVTGQWKKPGCI